MQPAGFGYTPAPYTPSMPSSSARFGHPDVTFSGGIGSLDYGRIPTTGGGRRRHQKKTRKGRKARKAAKRNGHGTRRRR